MTAENPQRFQFNIDEAAPVPEIINIPNIQHVSTNQQLHNSSDMALNTTQPEVLPLIRKKCRVIKYCAVPLCLIELLFILPKAYPLLITLGFPVLGFIGARRYNEFLIKLFGAYLIALAFIQILAMIILKGTAYIVLQTLFMLFEIFVAAVAIQVGVMMHKLSAQDWLSLNTS